MRIKSVDELGTVVELSKDDAWTLAMALGVASLEADAASSRLEQVGLSKDDHIEWAARWATYESAFKALAMAMDGLGHYTPRSKGDDWDLSELLDE